MSKYNNFTLYSLQITQIIFSRSPSIFNLFQFWVKLSSFARNTHYDVIGLEPNRIYNFRVRAENQYGVSDPLQADEPITAKFPFTVPDPPGQPRVIDWDTSNATVVWTKPLSDGGSRIQVLFTRINLTVAKYGFIVKSKIQVFAFFPSSNFEKQKNHSFEIAPSFNIVVRKTYRVTRSSSAIPLRTCNGVWRTTTCSKIPHTCVMV